MLICRCDDLEILPLGLSPTFPQLQPCFLSSLQATVQFDVHMSCASSLKGSLLVVLPNRAQESVLGLIHCLPRPVYLAVLSSQWEAAVLCHP